VLAYLIKLQCSRSRLFGRDRFSA